MPLRLSSRSGRESSQHPVRQGVTIAVLVLVIFWLGSLIWGLAGKAQFAWSTARETQSEAAALRAREEILKANIATLNTPRGKEAAIRTAFGVARPGEQVIIVVPPQPATSTATTTPWWQHVFGWVGL
ncbi:MAG: hypothetical protein B7X04_04055 [Parcubacteria group bacterium 21-54-25]|nr:MAG: hypothetical protein B7X04_04055 [Parcubacteria group bacterium 21-54-25]HQU08133.1 septum formation initiator family protein [Candidatus Paceibacterota bacterium]